MKIALFAGIILFFLCCPSGNAARAENPQDCGAVMQDTVRGYFQIIYEMASYKALIDAGYEACSAAYPDDFTPRQDSHERIRSNTDAELAQSRAVLMHALSGVRDTESCEGDDKAYQATRRDLDMALDGRYESAFRRHVRSISAHAERIADKEEDALPLARRRHDSCRAALDLLDQYERHHDRIARLQYMMYEFLRHNARLDGMSAREQRRLFRDFAGIRDMLADDRDKDEAQDEESDSAG